MFKLKVKLKAKKCRVVHCRKEPYDVYIGRPSKWGNLFKIGMLYQGRKLTREDAIEAYEDWLMNSIEGVELQKDISELKGKILGCWCKPKACHGDILAAIADEKG